MVTITRATPQEVSWRVGNSLTIESTREAVEHWLSEAEIGHAVYVDGLALTVGDLSIMRAAMDDMWDAHREKRLERARDFESNWDRS